jgi:hypothetical protein
VHPVVIPPYLASLLSPDGGAFTPAYSSMKEPPWRRIKATSSLKVLPSEMDQAEVRLIR